MSTSYIRTTDDCRHRCYIYPDSDLQLPYLISHAGHHRISSHDYSWHGLQRGNSRNALIQYTLQGRGALEYQGQTYDLLPGQAMLLLIPEDHRYFLPASSNYYEVIYLSLCGEGAMEMLAAIRRRFGVIVSLGKNSPPVAAMNQIFNHPETSVFSLSSRTYHFLMSLYEELERCSHPQIRPDYIDESLNYCRSHLKNDLSAEHLARLCKLSRCHYSREIKKWLGQSPGELVRSLRMKLALELLHNSQMSVKEISAECGFADVSYFIKVFQHFHHFTPGRRQHSHPGKCP